jgi:hypothetical protein
MNSRITGDPGGPAAAQSDLSPQVEEIILHAMSRNPQERYAIGDGDETDLDNPDRRCRSPGAPSGW